jgi:methionine-rich copper-binding protein CopC
MSEMRSIKFAVVTLLFVAAGALPALSHAMMTASVPKDGATVAAGLSAIELDFSRPVRLTVVGVVRAGDQKAMALVGELPSTFAKSATLKLEPLPAGSYKASWTGVAADGHVLSGSFAFSVGETPAAPKPAQ